MSDVDTNERRRNKRWPEALKREIVAATFEPGIVEAACSAHGRRKFFELAELQKAPMAIEAVRRNRRASRHRARDQRQTT